MESTYAEICTTPLLKKTGTKFLRTCLTAASLEFRLGRIGPASLRTTGSCTATCRRLPTTEAQAAMDARENWPCDLPNPIRAAMIATFQITGAT